MKPLKESFIKAKDLDNLNKKKYVLTDEKKSWNNSTLYRIQALKNIPSKKIKAGDLGGWIESYDNLDQKGDCWVGGEAFVYSDAKVFDNAWVYDNAWICGNAHVYGDAQVYGKAWVYGDAKLYDNAQVYGEAWVYDNAWIYGNAKVYGNARICGIAQVDYEVNKRTINK